jgi:hypothetical protein
LTQIDVHFLNESEYSQWDQLVNQSEQGTIFHSSKWITTVAKSLQIDYKIIGVFKDSVLIGGCSFYLLTKFHFYKFACTTVPLTPYGGFVVSPTKKIKIRSREFREHDIISLILEKIQTLKINHIDIINSPDFTDVRPFKWQGWYTRVLYTYILSLENKSFSDVSNNIKKNILKAQKLGIVVKNEYVPDRFWELTKLTFEKQNMKVPYRKEFLFDLMEMLIKNNLGEMRIAKLPSGDIISAYFTVYDSHYAYNWVAANDPKFKNTGVTSLLHFEQYKDLQNRGFKKLNMFGGNQSNLASFHSSFNSFLVPYYGVEKLQRIDKFLFLLR